MGLFKKTPQIEHPLFGPLTLESDTFWSGAGCRIPPEGTINVTVVAGLEGPTPDQERFFEELTTTYSSIRGAIAAALAEECDVPLEDVWKTFTLEHLQIQPHTPGGPQSWQVTFAHESEPDLMFTAEMEGDRPGSIVVDG